MKHERLLKALSKLVKVEIREEKWPTHTNTRYVAQNNNYVASWKIQEHEKEEGDVYSVYIHRVNDHNDLHSDYYAGSFYKTIKSILNVFT